MIVFDVIIAIGLAILALAAMVAVVGLAILAGIAILILCAMPVIAVEKCLKHLQEKEEEKIAARRLRSARGKRQSRLPS